MLTAVDLAVLHNGSATKTAITPLDIPGIRSGRFTVVVEF